MVKTTIGSIFGFSPKRMKNIKQLKAAESKIGAEIFGHQPGVRTEFFNDNLQSWFFYQEINGRGGKQSVTFHYEVHPDGILKIKNNEINGTIISGEELENFKAATRLYYERVMKQIYNKEPFSDKVSA